MKIWVDLATPPQVLFFRPIVAELQQRSHKVLVTTRDFSQTVTLATRFGLEQTVIGHHGGKTVAGKGLGIFRRTLGLAAFARGQGLDLAVSHNSYAQVLAGRLVGLPVTTLMDYEHQPANHIAFRFAHRIIVPDVFPDAQLRHYGARDEQVQRYSGLKEDMYLSDFTPDADALDGLNVPPGKVVVTMRPPATMATYHRFENPLFDQVFQYCLHDPNVCVVLLPRVAEQAESMSEYQGDNLVIPKEAVDGPNLIYSSDLVISAGGTMNREAAVLGTPVYTVYKGQMGAADQYLIDTGRMTQIAEPGDISKISLSKKDPGSGAIGNPDLVQSVTDMIVKVSSPC